MSDNSNSHHDDEELGAPPVKPSPIATSSPASIRWLNYARAAIVFYMLLAAALLGYYSWLLVSRQGAQELSDMVSDITVDVLGGMIRGRNSFSRSRRVFSNFFPILSGTRKLKASMMAPTPRLPISSAALKMLPMPIRLLQRPMRPALFPL